nr:CBS domain-containing protein [Actinomycetales bacterium]
MIPMLVREVMTSPVVTVPVSWSVRQAIRLLYDKDITAAPVVDEQGRMVGIISEMDLLRGEFDTDRRVFLRPSAPVDLAPSPGIEEVMTPNVRTVQEDDDVMAAVDLMITMGVKSVPVLRGEQLTGIVSRRDLMGMVAYGDARIRDDVLAALRDSDETSAWRVAVHDGVVELYGDAADASAARKAEMIARSVPEVVDVVLRGGGW